jgi:hypothetical protein
LYEQLPCSRPQKAKLKSLVVSKQLENPRVANFLVPGLKAIAPKGATQMAHEPESEPAIPAAANKSRHTKNLELEKPI